jgi:hypothetical protein
MYGKTVVKSMCLPFSYADFLLPSKQTGYAHAPVKDRSSRADGMRRKKKRKLPRRKQVSLRPWWEGEISAGSQLRSESFLCAGWWVLGLWLGRNCREHSVALPTLQIVRVEPEQAGTHSNTQKSTIGHSDIVGDPTPANRLAVRSANCADF